MAWAALRSLLCCPVCREVEAVTLVVGPPVVLQAQSFCCVPGMCRLDRVPSSNPRALCSTSTLNLASPQTRGKVLPSPPSGHGDVGAGGLSEVAPGGLVPLWHFRRFRGSASGHKRALCLNHASVSALHVSIHRVESKASSPCSRDHQQVLCET